MALPTSFDPNRASTTANMNKPRKPSIRYERSGAPLRFTRPEKNLPDMSQSKRATELMWPEAYIQPRAANILLNNAILQTKLYLKDVELNKARTQLKNKKKIISKTWKELATKEAELRQNFIHFNQFAKDNEEKRQRAQRKIIEENRLVAKRTEDIENMQHQAQQMLTLAKFIDGWVQDHRIFQDFLQRVVDATGDFETLYDIPSKFSSMNEEKRLLGVKQKEAMEVLEKSKLIMMKLIEEKNFAIMGLNNQIANLQARYENANIKALESEELVTEIKNNAVLQLNQIDTVKNSIWNVYVHMATSKKHPLKIKKENVEEQMMYINRTLTELNKVNKLINKKSIKLK